MKKKIKFQSALRIIAAAFFLISGFFNAAAFDFGGVLTNDLASEKRLSAWSYGEPVF